MQVRELPIEISLHVVLSQHQEKPVGMARCLLNRLFAPIYEYKLAGGDWHVSV